MKISIVTTAIVITAICVLTCSRNSKCQSVTAAQKSTAPITVGQSAFACDTIALTPEQRKRHFEELGPILRSLKKSVNELPDGYEFEFPGDAKTFQLVTEWTIQEHLCCPFFDIEVRLDRESGPLWLRLTGSEGAKQFINADAATWLKK